MTQSGKKDFGLRLCIHPAQSEVHDFRSQWLHDSDATRIATLQAMAFGQLFKHLKLQLGNHQSGTRPMRPSFMIS